MPPGLYFLDAEYRRRPATRDEAPQAMPSTDARCDAMIVDATSFRRRHTVIAARSRAYFHFGHI